MNAETILANLTDVYNDFRHRSKTMRRFAAMAEDKVSSAIDNGQALAFEKAAERINSFIHEVSRPRVETQALFDGFVATRVERLSTALSLPFNPRQYE